MALILNHAHWQRDEALIGVCEIYIFTDVLRYSLLYLDCGLLERENGKEDCLWVPALNFKEIQKKYNVTLRNQKHIFEKDAQLWKWEYAESVFVQKYHIWKGYVNHYYFYGSYLVFGLLDSSCTICVWMIREIIWILRKGVLFLFFWFSTGES